MDNTNTPDEVETPTPPWLKGKRFIQKPGEFPPLEEFIEELRRKIFDPTQTRKVKSNISPEQETALKSLRKWNSDPGNKRMFRIQDKGSRLVVEFKDVYIDKVNEYLEDVSIFRRDVEDNTISNRRKVLAWCKKWKSRKVISGKEEEWIAIKDTSPGRIYGNVKAHKVGHPYRFILSGEGTAIENLGRWVEYHLKESSTQHPAYLKDTRHFLRYIENINCSEFNISPKSTTLVSRDIKNYYPSCDTQKCIESIEEALQKRGKNDPPIECIIEAVKLTMSCNQCEFQGEFFTQIDGATIGGADSGSITDIFGAYVIDAKIREECPWSTETYMRYRDDTFEITNNGIEIEKQKTEWMNNNIYRKIEFTDNLLEDAMGRAVFLDTRITVDKNRDGNYLLSTSTYSKPTDTHQYLSPKSCHPRSNIEHIPYGVIHRIRRNASSNPIFNEQAVRYKAYLMKSGYEEEHIDDQFCKILKYKRKTLIEERKKRKNNNRVKVRFITDYEPAFPSIKKALKEMEPRILENDLLKRMLPNGIGSIQIATRRGGKNIKELLATTKINHQDERAQREGHCGPCGKPCVHCHKLEETEGGTFRSKVTKRKHIIRQKMNCMSKMVIYLVTCKKCAIQGVGSTDIVYKRISNYKSNILAKKATCGIEEHFLIEGHTYEDFAIQLIAQVENVPINRKAAFKRLRRFEGYWQMELCTIRPNGMNTINEYHRNKFSQDKPSFSSI